MIRLFFLNPITIWFKYVIKYLIIQIRESNVYIDYLSYPNNVLFGSYIYIGRFSLLNNCSVGSFSYTSSDCVLNNVEIGKFCSIGMNVKIGLGIHPSTKFVSTHPIFYSSRKQVFISFCTESVFTETKKVIIGNDVWIGANSIILDGVVIGDGAIISAGAVVNKDVPPYTIFGGVPAKFIKYRFEPNEILFLQEFKWWDRDINWLKNNSHMFNNINEFIKKYK